MSTGRFLPALVTLVALWPVCAAAALTADLGGAEEVRLREVADADIRIDGRLDEVIWSELEVIDAFSVIEPDTLAEPVHRTEVRLFYTPAGLYVGVTAHQPDDTIIARISPRDQRINTDGVSVTLDPTGRGLFGYWFGLNLGNTKLDGTVLPERQFSNEWDGPWRGATAQGEGFWTAEYFLPWSMMVLPESNAAVDRRMGLYVSRKVAYLDERWAIPALPRTRPQFMTALQPLTLRGIRPRRQLTFYPYSSAAWDERENDFEQRVGADIYWRPMPNMQLSTTLNPDFGVVQQDDLVINLSAFEVFFRERRPFFLEGQEIFNTSPRTNGFNGPPMTLINTRRIGAPADLPDLDEVDSYREKDSGELTELFGAAKLTGQQGAFRYGTLVALEKESSALATLVDGSEDTIDVDGRNFAAVRGLWESNRSGEYRGLGMIGTFVNRPEYDAFSGAIDGHLLTGGGRWKVDGQLMVSDVDQETGFGMAVDTVFTPQRGESHILSVDLMDDEFDLNNFGFLRRNDQFNVRYRYQRTRSGLDYVRSHTSELFIVNGWNGDHEYISSGLFYNNEWLRNDLSEVRLEVGVRPQRWDDRNSFGNGSFRTETRLRSELRYASNDSKALSFQVGMEAEQEVLGDVTLRSTGRVVYRPSDQLTAEVELTYRDINGWLLHQDDKDFTTFDGSRWDQRFTLAYFFNARQQLSASMQWVALKAWEEDFYVLDDNGHLQDRIKSPGADPDDFVISNMLVQLRYRWEFAPLSDLFVVYTRGGDLDGAEPDRYPGLLRDTFSNPDTDTLIVMLRYRMGS